MQSVNSGRWQCGLVATCQGERRIPTLQPALRRSTACEVECLPKQDVAHQLATSLCQCTYDEQGLIIVVEADCGSAHRCIDCGEPMEMQTSGQKTWFAHNALRRRPPQPDKNVLAVEATHRGLFSYPERLS